MIDLTTKPSRALFEKLLSDVQEKQHAEISFPISQKKLHGAAEAFLTFLTLPQEKKDALYQPHPRDPRDSGIGYVRKKKEEGYSDDKEYFHYVPLAEDYFKTYLAEREPKVENFFTAAREIYRDAGEAMDRVLRVFEIEFPGVYTCFFPLEHENPRMPLRFLKYNVQGKGNFLARGHYDIAGCTLALAESAPGLRIGENDETLKPVQRGEGGVIFMPALNFPKLTDERCTPAWHDVVQESDNSIDDETARWAIVLFLAPKDLPFPSFEEVHRPLE